MTSPFPIAKITRPRLSGIVERKRLHRLLDGHGKPIVWVSGPAGAGKTTLVAGYLEERKVRSLWYQVDETDVDPATFFYYLGLAAKQAAPRTRTPLPLLTAEYLPGLPLFNKRYFEKLFGRVKPPFVLVLDNYQDVAAQAGFHDLIREALSAIPEGIRVVIISRTEPPPQLARFRADRNMDVIEWEDLRFTLEESKRLILSGSKAGPSNAVVEQLHSHTEGWAAGLVLMSRALDLKRFGADLPEKRTLAEIFDYFAGEIFDKTDEKSRDFLLRTAFLPAMTPAAAGRLTGFSQADRFLSDLRRNHFFITCNAESTYQYHPLFRAFLLARGRETFPKEELASINGSAAAILKENGYPEDAVSLLTDAADWNALVGLILELAPALARQGRFQTLEAWIVRLPEDVLDAVPWLRFWLGNCRMLFDPAEGRRHLETAFELFKAQKDPAGLFLSCSTIIDTFIYELDDFSPLGRWIQELDVLLKQHRDLPSKDIETRVTYAMFSALMFHQPYRSDLPQWSERLYAIMHNCPDLNYRVMIGSMLTMLYSWTGDYAAFQSIMHELSPFVSRPEITPLARITWYSMEAIYQWITAGFDKCEQSIARGIETADASGIHVYDSLLYSQGVYNALISGDLDTSAEYLKKMALTTDLTKRMHACHYNYHRAWDAFSRGDRSAALGCCRTAYALQSNAGWHFVTGIAAVLLAQILFENGEHDEAARLLAEARDVGASMKSLVLQFGALMLESYFLFNSKARDAAPGGVSVLKKAMELGRKADLMNLQGLKRSTTALLCAKALEAGIETEYVRRLVAAHKLMPEVLPDHIETWPWPVRIFTLGRFEIEKDGKPLRFAGKVQKKPLDLLKAIIAFGATDVHEERLTDALWPDADGDLAYKSVENNVGRLRRLLGSDRAIVVREGRLSVDPRFCWIDAAMFEKLIQNADAMWNEEGGPGGEFAIPARLEKALALYRGDFLAGEDGLAWAASRRETVKNGFLRMLMLLTRYYYGENDIEKAIEYCRKGIDSDALGEEFYRNLMLCYKKLGRESEAVRAYHQCKEALAKGLGIEPSSATVEIYRDLAARKK